MFSLSEFYSQVVSNQWTGDITDTAGGILGSDLCQSYMDVLTNSETTVQHGDKVIIAADNSVNSVAWMLALWHLGAAVVPVKSGMARHSIESIAQDCNAKFLIENNQVAPLENWQSLPKTFAYRTEARVTGVDLALLIYTSGSTGTPKGIMLTHQNVLTSLQSISQYLRIEKDDRILCLSPLSFDYGLYQALFALYRPCRTLLYGSTFNPMAVIKLLAAERITLLPLVPAMASALARLLPVLKPDLSCLRAITNTGGHLPDSVIHSWKRFHSELNVFAMYGLTECKRALYLEPEFWQQKPGSVGKPIPGLDAKVFIETEQGLIEANAGEVGELYVRGSAVMQAYCDPNAQGGARLIAGSYRADNWLATGDLFCVDEDGFFYFKGRSKDLIKQAGFCLYPKEIEAQVESCPFVDLAAVIASVDANGDEVAVAVIQLSQCDEETERYASDWIKDNLDKDYTPRNIRFIEKLALTDNSKIDKKQLEKDILVS